MRQELRPIREDVNLARKYLSERAERFYAALSCIQEGSEIDD